MEELIYPQCSRCKLSLTRRLVVQPERGQFARVLFLGRDPGEVEDRTGRPLNPDAPAGGLLRRMVAQAGIPVEWCAWDNVVHCHTPANRGPTADEVAACSVWVRRVVLAMRPEVIAVLGQEAVEALYNPLGYAPKKPTITLAGGHGMVHGLRIGDFTTKVVLCYHPSGGLRSGQQRRLLAGDIKVVARLLGVRQSTPEYMRVVGNDASWLGADMVAIDAEWSMADGHILGLGVAWRQAGVLCAQWYPVDMLDVPRWGLQRVTVVGHSIKDDMRVLSKCGFVINNPHDTMLMAHVLRREQFVGGLGLKELAVADLGWTWDTLDMLGPPESLSEEVLGEYCCNDVASTLVLAEKYLGQLEET